MITLPPQRNQMSLHVPSKGTINNNKNINSSCMSQDLKKNITYFCECDFAAPDDTTTIGQCEASVI